MRLFKMLYIVITFVAIFKHFPVQLYLCGIIILQKLVQVLVVPALNTRGAAALEGLLQFVHLNPNRVGGGCVMFFFCFEDAYKVFHNEEQIRCE